MKHLVFTGCSYGQQARAFQDLINIGYFGGLKTYNLQGSSLGSQYQLYSAMMFVQKLLDKGVESKNIFVICQWSSMFRETTFYDINKFEELKTFTTSFDAGTWKLTNNCEIYSQGIDNIGFVNIENQISTIYIERKKEHKEFKEFLLKSQPTNSPTERAIRYHFDIANLQNFLKINNIEYKFLFFNASLTGFNFDRSSSFLNDFDIKTVEKIKGVEKIEEVDNTKYILPKKWKESILYNDKKWSKYRNLIDWGNFILYNNDRIEYGGIDEFALENIGTIGYLSYGVKPVSFGDHLNQYGDFRYAVDSGLIDQVNNQFIKDWDYKNNKFKEITVDNYKNLKEYGSKVKLL
jgi:hypothetical protein